MRFSGMTAVAFPAQKAEMAKRPDDSLGVACRVLPPAPWHPLIVAAPRRITGLDAPIALEKREAGVAPEVVARKVDGGARPARYKPALRLVAQHRDKFGAIVGLAAQRFVRDDDRGSRQRGRRDAIEHVLRDGDAVERVLGFIPFVDVDHGWY